MPDIKPIVKTKTHSEKELRSLDTASPFKLIMATLSVIVTNCIALYGVIFKGWSSFALLVMFIIEGAMVVGIDGIKLQFRNSNWRVEKNLQNSGTSVFFFECFFIALFGFIILMAFGPRHSDHLAPAEVFVPIFNLIRHELRWPIIMLAVIRIERLLRDCHAAGAFGGPRNFPLSLGGGGWMMLLFFLGMLTPFLSPDEPNAYGGLIALILIKTTGEILGVWAIKLARLIPNK